MKTINIVGLGNGWEVAPKENNWGVNAVIFKRDVEVLFDMHDERKFTLIQKERRKKIIKLANEKNIPVYACHHIPDTTYRRYPIEDVMAMFPRAFFSNAVCYMIALALIEGVERINMYGVNQAKVVDKAITYKFKDIVSSYDLDVMDKGTREYVESMWDTEQIRNGTTVDEYFQQKPAVDYWVGVADGMGVDVNICTETEVCELIDKRCYGYQLTQEEMRGRYGPRNRSGYRKVRNEKPDYVF